MMREIVLYDANGSPVAELAKGEDGVWLYIREDDMDPPYTVDFGSMPGTNKMTADTVEDGGRVKFQVPKAVLENTGLVLGDVIHGHEGSYDIPYMFWLKIVRHTASDLE